MSVEADTVRYYAEIDRRDRRERAIEFRSETECEDIEAEAYDWLKERFGENTACMLIPAPWTDPDPASTVKAAREAFAKWRDALAEKRAVEYLED